MKQKVTINKLNKAISKKYKDIKINRVTLWHYLIKDLKMSYKNKIYKAYGKFCFNIYMKRKF